MGDERVNRRVILGAGAGMLASLSGCGRLFIEPERTTTTTPDRSDTPAPTTPTATTTATAAGTPTQTRTATAGSLPSDGIEVRDRRLSIRLGGGYAFVDYGFEVENTGERPVKDVEFRVDVRYAHEDVSRVVATDYPRFWFVPLEGRDGGDDEDGDEEDGLSQDDSEQVGEEVRFERDGRAEDSTATDRFAIELALRRVRRR